MVHNNKVLTVSYGTFSCTLEGFDDSFGTMKAIAEYFRDLASDDRYFGAEPPQPDAEMLTRIAQREIDRQVEAHSTESGAIVLRATSAAAATPISAPVPEDKPEDKPEIKPEPVADVAAEPAPELAPEPTPEPAPETKSEVATPEVIAVNDTQTQPKEAEVGAEVGAADTADAEPADEEVAQSVITMPDSVVEVEAVQDAVGDAEDSLSEEKDADKAETPAREAEAADTSVTDAAPEVIEMAEPADEVVQEIETAQEVPAPAAVPAADSIAAKLQRIRAVVSQSDPFTDTDDYGEDEDADGFSTAQPSGLSDALKGKDEISPETQEQDHDQKVVDILGQLDIAEATPKAKTDDQAGDADAEAGEDFFTDQDRGDDVELFEDLDIAETPEAADNTEDQVQDDAAGDEVVNILSDDAEEQASDEQASDPLQARVVKVKKADLEAAIATGQLEQIGEADDDTQAASPEPQEDTSLSPEDEADLMRELAEVEGDLSRDQETPEAADNIFGQDLDSEDEASDQPDRDEAAHAVLTNAVSEDEADLSRLMDAADEKLEDPETSTRHETYSQLRGAVAAAEAEKSAGGSVDGQSQDEAYRDDLASVVRPRRPAVDGSRSSRRVSDNRPAPLKLVAEQRIDQGVGVSQRGPVRPRRVMTAPATPANSSDATGTDSAFAEFAARVGATELPELLEAAAAYLSFVEGQDKFSRPQLMNKVRLVKQDDFNREDGLRSFGQLLRDGKIEKRGGGRFAASVGIGFRPDKREAG